MFKFVSLAAVVILSFSCDSSTVDSHQTSDIIFDQPFDLKIFSEANNADVELSIKYVDLVEDSRCPDGVRCVHAGNAKILVAINGNEYELNTSDNIGSVDATESGYKVTLVDLQPRHHVNKSYKKEKSVASFYVSKE